ncbi:MobF family relaxase [Mucilaginibacter psychrotolerans]|uniref:Conjugal transfer protein n=1 Tax=Mucilaginibacter psychrotolerans TaxID=1524096 RepID=A0A4Y8SFT1_9SPHI|nr:MobF family relaxase [Mucilaginibacter psychrotolerans]TFF37933.1 conjugal transfer protein [Mucilaginibacter psychrotolerans]
MIPSKSSRHAKTYFSDALEKTDYYLDNQELPGRLVGRLADRLGVTGPATKDIFFALCENINPRTGLPLTSRTKGNRTVGYDINFHCPKSVSVVHTLSDDNHILIAFEQSVRETMQDIEADAKTRVRKRGACEDRDTNELLYASFTHQTARPVDGHLPDPHLHTHCFVFNATWDEAEQQIKAGQFRDINRDMPYYQARFHKTLSDKLTDLGYGIRRTNQSFEIENVPQVAIDLFSKRTSEIGQIAKDKGITDARALGELGAKTRAKKQKGLSMDELKLTWRNQLRELAKHYSHDGTKPVRYGPKKGPDQSVDADCVDFAIRHSFERVSVMQDRRLLAIAYRQGIGQRHISLQGIGDCFNHDGRIIRITEQYKTLCTTEAVLAEERQMVELARKGQNRFLPLYNAAPSFDPKLNDQQAAAIEHLLTTTHQVTIVRGAAGTGKTTIMMEADKHFTAAGKKMFVVAPTAQASRGVLAAEGFADAQTVAKLLQDKELQKKLHNQILWVDEAGLLGIADTSALLTIAHQQDCRLIFGGDTRQHSSVVRGDALRILDMAAVLRTAEVTKIHRQKNVDYRAAVEDLSKGDIHGSFIKLTSIGAIKEVDPLKPNDQLIEDYLKAVKKRKSTLIVSPTHAQGKAVTEQVRIELKAAGLIGKKEIKARKLENLNLTEAQKSDWRNFAEGQQIQFSQNLPKIKRGSLWLVKEVTHCGVTISNHEQEAYLPLLKADCYDVYKETEIGLAKGDTVRITRNAFDKSNRRMDNGQMLTVSKVAKNGNVVLISKSKTTYMLDKDFGHLDHAYCTTSHSSQGKTVDEVFISQPTSTFTATDAKQFYVSVSRGKDAAHIYTDDCAALLEHAAQLGNRQSAIELVSHQYQDIDYRQQQHKEVYKKDNLKLTEH